MSQVYYINFKNLTTSTATLNLNTPLPNVTSLEITQVTVNGISGSYTGALYLCFGGFSPIIADGDGSVHSGQFCIQLHAGAGGGTCSTLYTNPITIFKAGSPIQRLSFITLSMTDESNAAFSEFTNMYISLRATYTPA